MTLLHPEFLYYMLPPLVVLFALLLTQKGQHEHFFDKDVIERLRVSSDTMTLQARNALFFLIAFFMIIALAEPVIEEGSVKVDAKSADIMVALDISDSMLATDIYPNRLEAAKQKVLSLLESAHHERIGIVAFAKESYLVSPLSLDKGAVSFLLRHLDTASLTQKGTDFLSVLEVVGKMQKKEEIKYLLLLSDGGDKNDFSSEIELAKKYNIRVFILATATKQGAPIRLQDGTFIKEKGEIVLSKLNEKIISLATKTGGVYIEQTTSLEDIKAMIDEIRAVSEKKELGVREVQKTRALFYYPLLIALLLLLMATSSLYKKRGTHKISLLLLFVLFANVESAKAGLFDFAKLKEAKAAYESGEFEKSANLYDEYAKESQKPEAYFNAGNALYKQKKYKEAIESYNKAAFEDKGQKAKTLSNMGNAYVKEAKEDGLQKAKEAYESSLNLQEDKETRENLQEVEKLLKKQNEKQESKEGESDKKSTSEEQKESQKSKESQAKEQKGEQEKSQETQDSKEKSESVPQESKKESKNSTQKESLKKDANSSGELKTKPHEQMSDAEQQKYLDLLNAQNSTYLYKLNDERPKYNGGDEKPW